jgi:hypothetical protein
MSSSSKPLRLKYLLSRYGKLVVIALVLSSTVAFASAALAYSAPPETRQVTEQTDVQSFETTVNTSAPVTGNTTLYESNRKLSNMPVYLLGASPNVTVIARTDVPDDRAVEITQQITIELYATRNSETFWSETRTLASDSERVTDGTLVSETTIDVREIRRGRLSEVQSEVESVGTLHAKIHVDTVYEADTYQGRLTVTAPMEITDRSYAIDAPRSDERSHATPVTRTITGAEETVTIGTPATPNATAQAGILPPVGPLALSTGSGIRGGLGMLALIAALLLWRLYSRLPDQEEMKRAYDKIRYADWISRGQLPESDTYERIAIEKFVDLLDLAIDSDNRVIHDSDQDLYAVIDGTCIYQYTEKRNRSTTSEPRPVREPKLNLEENQDQNQEDNLPPVTQMADSGNDFEKSDLASTPSKVADED